MPHLTNKILSKVESRIFVMLVILVLAFIAHLGMSVYHVYHGSSVVAAVMLSLGLVQLLIPAKIILSQTSVHSRFRFEGPAYGFRNSMVFRQLIAASSNSDDTAKLFAYLPRTLLNFTRYSMFHTFLTVVMLFSYIYFSCVIGYPLVDIGYASFDGTIVIGIAAICTVVSMIDLPITGRALDRIHRHLDALYIAPVKTTTVTRNKVVVTLS